MVINFQRRTLLQRAAAGAGAGLLAGAVVLLLGFLFPRFRDRLENAPHDTLQQLQADPDHPPDEVILVMVTQQDVEAFPQFGAWPWARNVYRAVIEFCSWAGARALVFDAVFTGRDTVESGTPDADFAAAIEKGRNVYLVALNRERATVVRGAETAAAVWEKFTLAAGEVAAFQPRRLEHLLLPNPPLIPPVRGLGLASVYHDESDNILRRNPAFFLVGEEQRPLASLPFAVAADLAGDAELNLDAGAAVIGGRRVPLTPEGEIRLRFYGPNDTLPRRNFRQVVAWYKAMKRLGDAEPEGELAAARELFRDRVVIVGYNMPGMEDIKATPMSRKHFGAEVMGTALVNVLRGDVLREPPYLLRAALVLGVGFLVGALLAGVPYFWAGLALAVAAAGGYLGGVWLAFAAGWLFPVAGPVAAGVFAGLGAVTVNYLTEGRQRRFLRNTFKTHLSEVLVDYLTEHPEKAGLGGEKREITLFFSDLQNFTTISEQIPPEKLSRILEKYFTLMTGIILARRGFLDKYEGDGIMAFWGAPLPEERHAELACLAAAESVAAMAQLKETFEEAGVELPRLRIGLNTAEVTVGNMGMAERINYTALGDGVNLAARLEGANKPFGSAIMVSETTRAQAGAAIETRELARLRVKGKARAITVYELLGKRGDVPADSRERAKRFESALERFRARRWEEARSIFNELAAGDKAAALYAEKCVELAAAPPGGDWDGVIELTTK